jgi:hypothetical protein
MQPCGHQLCTECGAALEEAAEATTAARGANGWAAPVCPFCNTEVAAFHQSSQADLSGSGWGSMAGGAHVASGRSAAAVPSSGSSVAGSMAGSASGPLSPSPEDTAREATADAAVAEVGGLPQLLSGCRCVTAM